LTEPLIKGVINLVFARGIDIGWILQEIGLDFIEFEKTLMTTMDGYLLFFVTPKFNLDNVGEEVQ
jgi:hypothetical protein